MSHVFGHKWTQRYVAEYAVDGRLAEIGIPRELLIDAAMRGHLDRRRATTLDFPGRGEYDAASTALRTICEEGGKTDGSWHRDSYLSIHVAIDADEKIAIAVTRGDDVTGTDGELDPRVVPLKGPNTVKATEKQRLPFGQGDEEVGVTLYYLLVYADADDLRIELSSPRVTDEDGQPAEWAERIIIGSIDLDGDYVRRKDLNSPVSPEIVINPIRKTG